MNFLGPVNRPIVPGSIGPSQEQKVYVYVPFSLPKKYYRLRKKTAQAHHLRMLGFARKEVHKECSEQFEGVVLLTQSYDHDPRERDSGESFCWHRRRTRRNFGKKNGRLSSFNFQEKWPQQISRKLLHISGISKPVVWGTRGLHPGFPWFSSFSWFPWFPQIQHSTPCLYLSESSSSFSCRFHERRPARKP